MPARRLASRIATPVPRATRPHVPVLALVMGALFMAACETPVAPRAAADAPLDAATAARGDEPEPGALDESAVEHETHDDAFRAARPPRGAVACELMVPPHASVDLRNVQILGGTGAGTIAIPGLRFATDATPNDGGPASAFRVYLIRPSITSGAHPGFLSRIDARGTTGTTATATEQGGSATQQDFRFLLSWRSAPRGLLVGAWYSAPTTVAVVARSTGRSRIAITLAGDARFVGNVPAGAPRPPRRGTVLIAADVVSPSYVECLRQR